MYSTHGLVLYLQYDKKFYQSIIYCKLFKNMSQVAFKLCDCIFKSKEGYHRYNDIIPKKLKTLFCSDLERHN